MLGLDEDRSRTTGPDLRDLVRRVTELEEFRDAAYERRVERVKEMADVLNRAANAEAAALRAEQSVIATRGEMVLELQSIQQRIDILLTRLLPGRTTT